MHFSLDNLELFVNLGVPDEERLVKQKILVTVSWDLPVKEPALSDNISDTVDYFAIEQLIRRFPDQKVWHLLEKLHTDLKQSIRHNFPLIENLQIRITKYPFINGSVSVQ